MHVVTMDSHSLSIAPPLPDGGGGGGEHWRLRRRSRERELERERERIWGQAMYGDRRSSAVSPASVSILRRPAPLPSPPSRRDPAPPRPSSLWRAPPHPACQTNPPPPTMHVVTIDSHSLSITPPVHFLTAASSAAAASQVAFVGAGAEGHEVNCRLPCAAPSLRLALARSASLCLAPPIPTL